MRHSADKQENGFKTCMIRNNKRCHTRWKPEMENPNKKRQEVTAVFTISRAISDANTGNTTASFVEMLTSISETNGRERIEQASEQAIMNTHGDTESTVQANLEQISKEAHCSSVIGSFGEFANLATESYTELKHKNITLNDDGILQDTKYPYEHLSMMGSRESTIWTVERYDMIDKFDNQHNAQSLSTAQDGRMKISSSCEENDDNFPICIAAHSPINAEETESKEISSRQRMKGILVIEAKELLTPAMELSFKNSAKGQVLKSMNESHKNPLTAVNAQGLNVTTTNLQTVLPVSMKANDESEIAGICSSARDPKSCVEIEEEEDFPAAIQPPAKQKTVKESSHSLRMLLLAEETALLAKRDEKEKRDCRGIEFPSKVVPASDHYENIEVSAPHKVTDYGNASSGFSEHAAFSGALTYQGLISFSEHVAYSRSISRGSDSSRSSRSFAFPILASEWNSSPIKMGAPDARFVRQQSKRNSFWCCRQPSTMFE